VIDRDLLIDVMGGSRYVLLDFDGPVCDVFAGLPPGDVADELRALLTASFTDPLPDDVVTSQDPLLIVHQVAGFAPHLSRDIDAALCRAELHAIESATPTPGVMEFIAACTDTTRPLAIVSNNSTPAIEKYLTKHGLSGGVRYVAGRDPSDPRRMKPDPFLLAQASAALNADPETTVLIGDSTTDIQAARAHGIQIIGYANKPGKQHTLAHADALTIDMADLAHITTRPPTTTTTPPVGTWPSR
jgi:phosphoglycolate phosphatase